MPAADTAGADWIVVIPVYRGYDETLAAVHAVLTAPQRTRFALHLVNDRSPDPALVAELERLAELGLFSFETNPVNLGFVKTCNRALRAFAGQEVVLLNADALVFGDWLDRMAAHARRDPKIATITPFSNNATICSYPLTNANNLVEPELDAAALDALAARTNAGRVSEVATGVGFCFFMSRTARDAVGIFDEEAFGRGYGEENDFCLRAAKAGFRNVLAEDIFALPSRRGVLRRSRCRRVRAGPEGAARQAPRLPRARRPAPAHRPGAARAHAARPRTPRALRRTTLHRDGVARARRRHRHAHPASRNAACRRGHRGRAPARRREEPLERRDHV